MKHLIDKSALVAEIEKLISNGQIKLQEAQECNDDESYVAWSEHIATCIKILSLLDTIKVKGVDLEKEYDNEFFKDPVFGKLVNRNAGISIAKHFFELGLSVSNMVTGADRGTAEEIIINLKRIEKDYQIDLTKEIEWLRNKVKKGE